MDREAILRVLGEEPIRSWPLKELMSKAEMHDNKEKNVRRTLKALVNEGKVEREPGRRFRLSRAGETIEGTVRIGRGRAEIVVSGPKSHPVPILQEDTERVNDGDRVRAEVTRGRRGGAAAKIVEVVRVAAPPRLIGTVRRLGKALFLEPEERRDRAAPRGPIVLDPSSRHEAEDGDLVHMEIVTPRTQTQAAVARVVEVLGKQGERETEIQRLLLEHDLPREFPAAVEAAAKKLGEEVDPSESARRVDLRKLALVTIDGENARDFDDAVYAEKYGKDSFKLFVAIADVSHYVRAGDAIDKEALSRGTSTYFTDRVFPMLPEVLSNNLCSLKPDVDRLCVVAEMIVDKDGHVGESKFYRAVMRSHARLTYTQVARALDGDPDEVTRRLLPNIVLLYHVAQLLLRRRLLRGAIDLDLPEAELKFDADGLPIDSVKRERNDAHRLIEDLMLAANEAVAAFFEDRDLPTIFRIHEDPDPLKLQAFIDLCQSIGLPVKLKKNKIRPKDVALLLDDLREHPSGKHLHNLLLRTLSQARYYPENEGHFGLAAERYLHFTSPIRRYPDLMVHRLLMAHHEERDTGYSTTELTSISEQSSAAERRAMLAERACRDLDRAYVAALHVGEQLSGTITAIAAFGIFVAVDKPFIEGLIPIQYIGDDYWEPDEHGAFLYGRTSGERLHLGMQLFVEIVAVNISRRQVEMRPLWDVKTEEMSEEEDAFQRAYSRLPAVELRKKRGAERDDKRGPEPAVEVAPSRGKHGKNKRRDEPREQTARGRSKGRKKAPRGGRGEPRSSSARGADRGGRGRGKRR